jgi:hypothetical protein
MQIFSSYAKPRSTFCLSSGLHIDLKRIYLILNGDMPRAQWFERV